MSKIPSLLACGTFLFGSLVLAVPAAEAATFTVTKTTDTADGSCSVSDCSLREAVIAANAAPGDDLISLPAGTYTLTRANGGGDEDLASTGDLDITENLTLTGASSATTILDANGDTLADRAFELLSSSTFGLSQVTIQGGLVSGENGGAINASAGGELTITDAVFQNNSADYGGAIEAGGSTPITMSNSTFSSNTATVSSGGAINSDDLLNITDSAFRDNVAEASAGAVSSGGALVITGSTFSGNSIAGISDSYEGGAIRAGYDITISDSTFENNESPTAGALKQLCINQPLTLTITNSTFVGNTASNEASGDGGAIIVSCDSIFGTVTTTVNISHSTFTGNSAGDLGGAFYANEGGDDNVNVNVKNSIFSDNTANAVADSNCSVLAATITTNGNNIDSGTSCGFGSADGNMSSTDPELDTAGLEDNGGLTETIALQFSSPAKDAGNCTDNSSTAVDTDQRGFARPEGGSCDIGAYEFDQTIPVISVTGDATANHQCGLAYVDAGATATDNFDGSIAVSTDANTVDEGVPGEYEVEYSVADNDGNEDAATRSVTVIDTTDPVVTPIGATPVVVKQYASYTDAGATATDSCDQASLSIVTDNPVNPAVVGNYTVTYSTTDVSGNTGSATRTVQVVSRGDAVSLETLDNNRVKVTYEDNSTRTFTVFETGTGIPKAKFSKEMQRFVALKKNGTRLRVFDASSGELLDGLEMRTNPQDKAKLKVLNYYPNLNEKNEIIVTTKRGDTFRTSVVSLTAASNLTNKNTEKLEPFAPADWQVEKNEDRLLVKRLNDSLLVKYRVTKLGNLVPID